MYNFLFHDLATLVLKLKYLFIMADLPFVVLKFIPDNNDSDIYYDIGLTKWLIEMNEDMEGETYWPPQNVEAGNLVRKEVNADETWPKYRVHIKRYHDEYVKARNNVRGITKHDDSNYETEKELGKGKRRKTNKKLSSTSDSEEEKLVKKSTKAVAAPPKVQLPLRCEFYDSVPSCSYSNESQKKKINIKVNSHKSQKIQKQQAPLNRFDVKRKLQLVQNVLDARKRTAEQFQKKLPLQSLSNNRIINTTNSLKKLPQEHQIELVHMHTERLKCNKSTLSEKNEVTEKNYNKLQQSGKIPQLPDVEKNSDFESSVDFIYSTEDSVANSTEDSVANYAAVKKPMPNIHADIPSEAASNSEHIELPQFCSKNIDESQKSSFTSSERDLNLQLIKVLNRKLEEINCKIDTVIMNQGKLNRSLLPHEKKRLKPHNMPSLPLTNESDVQAMEKWLLCDAENNIALCNYLTSFGSTSDEKKAVTTIMQKVMYNSLAKNYNFDGHGEKIGFRTLNLWTVIEGALLLKFPDSDLDITLKTIKSWLRNASGRKQEDECNGSDSQQ